MCSMQWIMTDIGLSAIWVKDDEEVEEVKDYHPCDDSGGIICPYGVLVEQFPLEEEGLETCKRYGHVCPYHYVAEMV